MCGAGFPALHFRASIQAHLRLQTIFHDPGPNGEDIALKPIVFADNHAEHTQRAGEILDIEHAARLKRRRQHRQSLSMGGDEGRSEEHTSELQSLMRISYAVFCLKKK